MPEIFSPALIIFLLTYLGVALGEIPGLAIDRTGIALLGAVAMIGFGVLDTARAVAAVDYPTILLLFGLMVVSSQFRLGGFYTRIALALTAAMDRPRRFLGLLMMVSAALSALLANDIICLAFTPVLARALVRKRLNPIPFLLALAISSNIGSAATIIGNPQNMLLGQVGGLSFGRFLLWCGMPSLLSLGASFGILCGLYRGGWHGDGWVPATAPGPWPDYDPGQSRKGLIVVALLVGAFFTPASRELSALVAAGVLLCSRKMATRSLMGLVDWHLLTLFIGLFVVVRGFEDSGWPAWLVEMSRQHGVRLDARQYLRRQRDHDRQHPNLIAIEQARIAGIRITFREHARAGVPVTIASLLILALWITLMR